jgi:tyrosyl-tRNA synthetase
LIRRLRQEETYGLTVPLITRSDGKKMGKTEKGSLFLDANLTPPYEFYQYWRNVPDQDVEQFLKIFTELSLDEIHDLTRYQDERINHAKERLAWEITQMVHGEDEANACQRAARAAFGGEGDLAGMPTLTISQQEWDQGILIPDLLVRAGLSPSKTESRRLIQQGGISINQLKIDNPEFLVNSKLDLAVPILLKAGKKRRVHLMIESS